MFQDKLEILLVEDNSIDAMDVRRSLNSQYLPISMDWCHVTLFSKAIDILKCKDFSVVLLDLSLPDLSGLETVSEMRKHAPHIPIVVMSGYDDEVTAIKAVQNGAQDYLVKGNTNGQSVMRSIYYAIERQSAEKELLNHKNHLEEMIHERTARLSEINHYLEKEIKEREIAQDSLRRSEERYRLLLESISDVVFLINNDFRLMMVNRAGRKLMRKTLGKITGKSLLNILPDFSSEHFLSTFQSVTKTNKTQTVVEKFERGLNQVLWYETHLYPVPEGVLCISRDITERKLSEEKIIKMSNKLHVYSSQLQVANDKLEMLNRTKSEFLAELSHELRTPLNVILANSQMMEKGFFGNLNDTQHNKVSDMLNQAHSLLRLVSDILDVSKITSNKMTLQYGWFSLTHLMKSLVSNMIALADGKKIVINHELDKEIEIFGDRFRLQQAISNILTNAIKFTSEGFIDVSISRVKDARVRIDVKDTGIGIESSHLNDIFKDFHQFSHQVLTGAGLGLPIARKLIEMHMGEIIVESEPGKGSLFSVYLPVHRDIEMKNERKNEAKQPVSKEKTRRKVKKSKANKKEPVRPASL
ncbi:MAG: ATP-binding protein [Spirochaetota bacterium]|nr:ATP-binding protein [Spirochaetota bacterium]